MIRRDFLKLAAASLTMAATSSCESVLRPRAIYEKTGDTLTEKLERELRKQDP